jgi:multiple sugar transport system substrate-binding protein
MGPVRRIAAEHVMNCYVIWSFSDNQSGAKQFLVDYVDSFRDTFKASEFYNFPCFPQTVPDLKEQIANDPKASPSDKYKVLADAPDWATNVGYPGFATAAIDEVFCTFQLPTMFARVARDEMSPEEAARAAEREIKRIFAKWNQLSLR